MSLNHVVHKEKQPLYVQVYPAPVDYSGLVLKCWSRPSFLHFLHFCISSFQSVQKRITTEQMRIKKHFCGWRRGIVGPGWARGVKRVRGQMQNKSAHYGQFDDIWPERVTESLSDGHEGQSTWLSFSNSHNSLSSLRMATKIHPGKDLSLSYLLCAQQCPRGVQHTLGKSTEYIRVARWNLTMICMLHW